MIICISPAKTLDETPASADLSFTMPDYLLRSEKLIRKLKSLSRKKIKSLMDLSDNLARLNQERYQAFSPPFTIENSKQCVFMFKGDVYEGLSVNDFSPEDLNFAQKHLRILSGLYGILRPLDLIQPYRLEMGTTLAVGRKKNLYDFWSKDITSYLNTLFAESQEKTLINLASIEYFKSIDPTKLKARVISPVFKEERDGELVLISFFAKKARGLLARFIIKNTITNPEDIKAFDLEGYTFNQDLSTAENPLFTRKS